MVLAGLDIAKEVARQNKLPPVDGPEDVENYPTAKLLDLSYRMGLLTRAQWRRMTRVYEIRRDLEHEDDEYEAGVQDCIYVFTTCIEAVLSQDPVTLLRVTEVKEIVEAPRPVVPDARLVEDYRHAPDTRQEDILRFLVSVARDGDKPDIVRQNSYSALQLLSPHARNTVKVAVAGHVQKKVGRDVLTDLDARVAHAAGIFPYLRRVQRRQFFEDYYERMRRIGHGWRSHREHGALLRTLQEVGGLTAVPDDDLRAKILLWLVQAYMGEPGGYGGMGRDRPVFYSNSAAPLIEEIVHAERDTITEALHGMRGTRPVQRASQNEHVARRYEDLLNLVGG